MKTRVVNLKSEQVSAATFSLVDGEVCRIGVKPLTDEDPQDDFVPITDNCRFVTKGKTVTRNTFNSIVLTSEDPILKIGNVNWADIIGIGDTEGFCLSTLNPFHKTVGMDRITLKPNEVKHLTIKGYICGAVGIYDINGTFFKPLKISKLSGNEIIITAGKNGAILGYIEVEEVGES
jgi:hypothetical protein